MGLTDYGLNYLHTSGVSAGTNNNNRNMFTNSSSSSLPPMISPPTAQNSVDLSMESIPNTHEEFTSQIGVQYASPSMVVLEKPRQPRGIVPVYNTNNPPAIVPVYNTNHLPATVPVYNTNNSPVIVPVYNTNNPPATVPVFNTNNSPAIVPVYNTNNPTATVPVFNTNNSPAIVPVYNTNNPTATVPVYNTNNPPYRNRFSADSPIRHYSQETTPIIESGYISPTIFQRSLELQTFNNYQNCAPPTGLTYEYSVINTPHNNCYSEPSPTALPMKLPTRVAPARNTNSKAITSFNVPSAQITEAEPITITDDDDETECLEMYVFDTKRVLIEYEFQYLHPSFYRCLSCVNAFNANSFKSFHDHVWMHINTDFKISGPSSYFTLPTEMKYYIDGYVQKMIQLSLDYDDVIILKLQIEFDRNLCKLCAFYFGTAKGCGDVTLSKMVKRVAQAIVQVSGKTDVPEPSVDNMLFDFKSDNDRRDLIYKCTFIPGKEVNIVRCGLCSEFFELSAMTLEIHAHNRHFEQTASEVNGLINTLTHFASRLDKIPRGNVYKISAEVQMTFSKQIAGCCALSVYKIFEDVSDKKPVIISSYVSEVTISPVEPQINKLVNYMNKVPSKRYQLTDASMACTKRSLKARTNNTDGNSVSNRIRHNTKDADDKSEEIDSQVDESQPTVVTQSESKGPDMEPKGGHHECLPQLVGKKLTDSAEAEITNGIEKIGGKQLLQETSHCSNATRIRHSNVAIDRDCGVSQDSIDGENMESVAGKDDQMGFYKCSVDCCSYSSILPDELVTHMREMHNEITKFTCFLCRKVFSHNYSLCLHLVHDHTNSEDNSRHELFRCSDENCEFHTDSLDQYIGHYKDVHSTSAAFRCFNCSNEFSNTELLERHFLKYLQNTVSCGYCSGRSFSRSCMLNHISDSHKHRKASVSVVKFLSCSRLPTTEDPPLTTTDHTTTLQPVKAPSTSISEAAQLSSPSGSKPPIHNADFSDSGSDVCTKPAEQPSSERDFLVVSHVPLSPDRLQSNVEPESQASETVTQNSTPFEPMVTLTPKDSGVHEQISDRDMSHIEVTQSDTLTNGRQPSTDMQGSFSTMDTPEVAVVGKIAADTIPEHSCPLGSDQLHDALETFMRTTPISSDITCKKCGHCFKGAMGIQSRKRTIHVHILEHLKIYVHKCQLCSFKCVDCIQIFAHIEKQHSCSRFVQNQMIKTSVSNPFNILVNKPNIDPVDRHAVSTACVEKLLEEKKKIDKSILSNIVSASSNKGLLSGKLFCFRCTLCNDFTAPSRDAVIAHISAAKHSKVIGCKHCKFRSTDLEEIKQHCQDMHKENVSFFYLPTHAHVRKVIYRIEPEDNVQEKELAGQLCDDKNRTTSSENNVCPDHNDKHTPTSDYIADTPSMKGIVHPDTLSTKSGNISKSSPVKENSETDTGLVSTNNDGGEQNSLMSNSIDAELLDSSGAKRDESKEDCRAKQTLNTEPNGKHLGQHEDDNSLVNQITDQHFEERCQWKLSHKLNTSDKTRNSSTSKTTVLTTSESGTKHHTDTEDIQSCSKETQNVRFVDCSIINGPDSTKALSDERRSSDGRIILKINLGKTKHSEGFSNTDTCVSKRAREPSCKEDQSTHGPKKSHKAETAVRVSKKFKCIFCTKSAYKSMRVLIYHVAKHFNYRPYQCGICKSTWIHEKRAKKHHLAKHQGQDMDIRSTVDDKIVACIEMVKEQNEEGTARRIADWKCEQCSFSCHEVSVLRKHVERKHSQPFTESSTPTQSIADDKGTDINEGECSSDETEADGVCLDMSAPSAIEEGDGAETLNATSASGSSVCFCCHLCSFKTRKLDDFQMHILYGCHTDGQQNEDVDGDNPPNGIADLPLFDEVESATITDFVRDGQQHENVDEDNPPNGIADHSLTDEVQSATITDFVRDGQQNEDVDEDNPPNGIADRPLTDEVESATITDFVRDGQQNEDVDEDNPPNGIADLPITDEVESATITDFVSDPIPDEGRESGVTSVSSNIVRYSGSKDRESTFSLMYKCPFCPVSLSHDDLVLHVDDVHNGAAEDVGERSHKTSNESASATCTKDDDSYADVDMSPSSNFRTAKNAIDHVTKCIKIPSNDQQTVNDDDEVQIIDLTSDRERTGKQILTNAEPSFAHASSYKFTSLPNNHIRRPSKLRQSKKRSREADEQNKGKCDSLKRHHDSCEGENATTRKRLCLETNRIRWHFIQEDSDDDVIVDVYFQDEDQLESSVKDFISFDGGLENDNLLTSSIRCDSPEYRHNDEMVSR